MIHFLLTPDKTSSLALKRKVAECGARVNVIIGTWPELLTQAKNSYILPLSKNEWQANLSAAAKEMKTTFWLEEVPAEEDAIISTIGQHLTMLLEGLKPEQNLASLLSESLPGRLQQRLKDFIEFHASMGCIPND